VPVFALVIALLLGLLIPHLDLIARPNQWILPGAAAIIGLGLLLVGTLTSGFDARHRKPNSILYALNADTQKAIWASYDQAPDDWTAQFLGFNAKKGLVTSHLPSASQPLLHSEAPSVELVTPSVEFLDEDMSDGVRTLRMRITAPSQANLLRGICKSCGSASDHAATFSRSLPSTNSPFLNFAPALTNATR